MKDKPAIKPIFGKLQNVAEAQAVEELNHLLAKLLHVEVKEAFNTLSVSLYLPL